MKHLSGKSQQRFAKDKWYFPNLIKFNDKVTCSADVGEVVLIVYLDFSKSFDTVSHSLLFEKFMCCGTEKWPK